jgi:hypothetical protein
MLNLKLLPFLAIFLLNACVVRTQDFHCTLDSDPQQNAELRMSPTTLRFQSVDYDFNEERGASRIYQNKSLSRLLEFNPVSNKLLRSESPDQAWSCKRYDPF